MSKKRPLSHDDYAFFQDSRKEIQSISVLTKLINLISKYYFKYQETFLEQDIIDIANNAESHYSTFSIKKKNGGFRTISSPDLRLKKIQNCIRVILAGLFYHGCSTVNCAACHVGKDIVLNFDIKDFFSSINEAQITVKLLKKGHSYDVAKIIAALVTTKCKNGVRALPQGAPTSPIIADLVVEHMDKRLIGFARKHRLGYSRYVDDLTFSFSKTDKWNAYSQIVIKKIIESEGFIVNRKKTRISFSYQRQSVLGITVNARLNVTQKYIKNLRTILHNWEKDGYINANNNLIMHYCKNADKPISKVPRMEDIVAGKLSYLKMVRNAHNKMQYSLNQEHQDLPVDSVWEKLHDRYVALRKRDYSIITGNPRKMQSRIYRYGDDGGPLVYAIKEDENSKWHIIKVLTFEGQWVQADEDYAYRLRYGTSRWLDDLMPF